MNGGLTPSSEDYGGQPTTGNAGPIDYRMGGLGRNETDHVAVPECPRGPSDSPQMYNVAIERYFNYREHLPFMRWGCPF